tara:strand:- start:356 stop:1060 length:705 start_codon:yes stop_codon:yes gene_type:complete
MKELSIVFPIHNEEENIRDLVISWSQALVKNKIDYEFVLVEDGSTDKTKEIIKELEKKYPIINLSQNEKRYYSKAVVDGIYNSNKEYILCTDSDNQIKVETLIENVFSFPSENEFIFGFRNPRKDPIKRILISKAFKFLHDLLFNSKLKDPSCPFVIGLNKTFKKLQKEKLLMMREGFWWGFVGVCMINKMKFIERPVKHYARESGNSSYKINNILKIILINTIGLLKIKFSFK